MNGELPEAQGASPEPVAGGGLAAGISGGQLDLYGCESWTVKKAEH